MQHNHHSNSDCEQKTNLVQTRRLFQVYTRSVSEERTHNGSRDWWYQLFTPPTENSKRPLLNGGLAIEEEKGKLS